MSDNIDPIRYGVLWQKVEELDRKVDKMERGIDELLELANRSRGGFWMGMTVVAMCSTIVGWFIHMMGSK